MRTYSESEYKPVCFAGRQKGVFELGVSCDIGLLVFHKEVDMAVFCLRARKKLLVVVVILNPHNSEIAMRREQLQIVVA